MRPLFLPVLVFLLSIFVVPTPQVWAANPTANAVQKEVVTDRIRSGISLLNEVYWSPTLNIWLDHPGDDVRGHYEGRRNPPWWGSANAVEVLLDFMKVAGNSEYTVLVESLYDVHRDYRNKIPRIVEELRRRNQWSEADEQRLQRRQKRAKEVPANAVEYYTEFRNEYLDDSGWWGVTWLKMYDRSKDVRHLTTAKAIHTHMANNWRPKNGGGVMWSEDHDKMRPNAITNSLFLILSARLYKRTQEPAYLNWAEKTLEWFRTNKLYDGIGIVDAPGHKDDYWSYNQGTFIGGLLALYQATGRNEHLNEAVGIAETVISSSGLVTPNGVAVEKLGTGGDATLFKGVFLRYLAQLRDVLNAEKSHATTVQRIEHCIQNSVASLVRHNRDGKQLYGCSWEPSANEPTRNFNTQLSALAAMVAALPDPTP